VIYILYVQARFSTAQKRDRALQQATTNYLAQPGISNDLFVPAQTAAFNAPYKGWPNAMYVECRFITQAIRDNLWTQLDSYLTTANQAPDQAWGEHWDQMLDATDPDADTSRYNEFTKTWP
jgi:hypothetical protein